MAFSARTWRRIALTLAAVLAMLLAVLLVGFWLIVRIPSEARSLSLPPELESAGTLGGEGSLVREELFRDERLGLLTDLATGARGERIVVGRRGAAFVSPDWELLRYVPFSTRTTHVEVVDVEGDGTFEFLSRGGSGWADAALLGSDGSVRWTIGGMPGLNDVGHGDLDSDGLLDFVGGYNGFGGIRGISREGDELWRQSGGNIWHVELAAVDDVPGDEILHSDAGGALTIRGADGSVVTRHTLPFYVSHFTLVPWPAVGDPPHVVDAQGGFVWVVDLQGTVRAQFPCRFTETVTVQASPLGTGTDDLAFAAATSRRDRSLLTVWSDKQEVRYEEVLEGEVELVSSDPTAPDATAFLVGGDGVLYRYHPAGARDE